MRRMTEERQMMRLDGIGERVEQESAGRREKMFRDRLGTGSRRSVAFRVAWVDLATCPSESQCPD